MGPFRDDILPLERYQSEIRYGQSFQVHAQSNASHTVCIENASQESIYNGISFVLGQIDRVRSVYIYVRVNSKYHENNFFPNSVRASLIDHLTLLR